MFNPDTTYAGTREARGDVVSHPIIFPNGIPVYLCRLVLTKGPKRHVITEMREIG